MNELQKRMEEVGAHIGYAKSRRHPSTLPFIETAKQNRDIINLELTAKQLDEAKQFAASIKKEGGQVLFVGAKPEASRITREYADIANMPFVEMRWIGGTLTNFEEISKRVERLEKLLDQQEKGELVYQTKKEKLMLEREIESLENKFGGIRTMKKVPAALFIIDPRREHIAEEEAWQMNIPMIALANTDCSIERINYPIVANDTNIASIELFTKEITDVLR